MIEGRYGVSPLERVGGNGVPTRERLFPKKRRNVSKIEISSLLADFLFLHYGLRHKSIR